jgi:hypothetical protein
LEKRRNNFIGKWWIWWICIQHIRKIIALFENIKPDNEIDKKITSNLKHLILLAFFLSSALLSVAQTKVFKTYEEYREGKGEEMETQYGDYTVGTFGHVLKFKTKDGTLVKYKTDEIWGFLFQGKFFRSVGKKEIAMLMDTGKVNYYINGYAGMQSIIHPEKKRVNYF